MKPVTQSRVGEDGTCFRACVASIMEVPEKAVPDFGAFGNDECWWTDIQAWLAKAGLQYRRVPIDGAKPVGYSTIEGVSPRGGLHACVAYDGKLVHDPHPQDGTGRGLVEPRYYGVFHKKGRTAEDLATFITAPEASADQHVLQPVGDRADMTALRRNTERQGGPFFMQVTEKDGRERTMPIRNVAKGADSKIALESLSSKGRDAKFTVASANAALRARGYEERLVRGNGYYYFVDGDAHRWYSSAIATNSIANYDAAKIIRARNLLANDYRN